MSNNQYWLVKTDPWDGIRNYEARKSMRDDMKIGDQVLFYHFNVRPPQIVGTMEVASEPCSDPAQFDPDSKYFDEKSIEEDPAWELFEVKFIREFENLITRNA